MAETRTVRNLSLFHPHAVCSSKSRAKCSDAGLVCAQQAPEEFLDFILEGLHDDLNRGATGHGLGDFETKFLRIAAWGYIFL